MSAVVTPIPGAEPRFDAEGNEVVDLVTCGTCGRTWNDAQSSSWTPAPSARCPFEYEHKPAKTNGGARPGAGRPKVLDRAREVKVPLEARQQAKLRDIMAKRGCDRNTAIRWVIDRIPVDV